MGLADPSQYYGTKIITWEGLSWQSANVVTVDRAYWHHAKTVLPYVRFSRATRSQFRIDSPRVVPREKTLWVAPCRRNKTPATWHGGRCGAQKNRGRVSKHADTPSTGNITKHSNHCIERRHTQTQRGSATHTELNAKFATHTQVLQTLIRTVLITRNAHPQI